MRRAPPRPDETRASVVRLPHPRGGSPTLENPALVRRFLGFTALVGAATTVAAGSAFGAIGLAVSGALTGALLFAVWRRGRALEIVVDDERLTLPNGATLPRGRGVIVVDAVERTHKGGVIHRWRLSHSSGALVEDQCASALVVRACAEGLAFAGRWPLVWRPVVGAPEERDSAALDEPLHVRESREPLIPTEVRRPAGAFYDAEPLPDGGVRLRYGAGLTGRVTIDGVDDVVCMALLAVGVSAELGWWVGALALTPLIALVPAFTPDVEVTSAGITLRYRTFGGLTVKTRRLVASEIESVYFEGAATRLVVAGDRFHSTLARGRHSAELEWLRAIVVRALIGDRAESAAAGEPVRPSSGEVPRTPPRHDEGICPACARPRLERVGGELDEQRCPSCGGRFLSRYGSERLVEGELGITRDVLRDLTRYFAGERRACPSCRSRTSAVRLKGVTADLCQGCGGLWLDAGELTKLSAGRYDG